MNKTELRKFALEAREMLEKQIKLKIQTFHVDEEGVEFQNNGDIWILKGESFSITFTENDKSKWDVLNNMVKKEGLDNVVEKAAYTWFNRLVAIRYMELKDFLPMTNDFKSLGFNVLSSREGNVLPDILKFSNINNSELDIDIDLTEFQKFSDDEAKYKYLLLKVCNKISIVFPVVFGGDTRYADILIPDNLLNTNSIVAKVRECVNEDNCKDVQVIGWLYQYYNSLKKDEAMSKNTQYKKNEIPYVTQLFTPEWIVRYMVENSLLRYYVEYNDSKLYEEVENVGANPRCLKFKYFIKDNLSIKNEPIDPKDIKFIDPCMGSGHILVYAFDVLYSIYKDSGYSEKDIAFNIITNNLYGLDIDDRAGQLSILSILLKARERDKDIFKKFFEESYNAIKYNKENCKDTIDIDEFTYNPTKIMAMDESNDIEQSSINYVIGELKKIDKIEGVKKRQDLFNYVISMTKDIKEIGSALIVHNHGGNLVDDLKDLYSNVNGIDTETSGLTGVYYRTERNKILNLIKECIILASKYDVVVTNPPYLNSSKMSNILKEYVNENYGEVKSDLFSVFIERNTYLCKKTSYLGFMTPYVWMFILSYKNLREMIIRRGIASLIQLEYSALDEAIVPLCTFILSADRIEKGIYYRLSDFKGGMSVQDEKFREFKDAPLNQKPAYKFEVPINKFNDTPGNVICYWASDAVLKMFSSERIEKYGDAKKGLSTADNKLYLRNWHEVNINDIGIKLEKYELPYKWIPINKGGEYRNWYGNNEYIINWYDDGKELKQYEKSVIRNEVYYFRKSITWTMLSSSQFGVRASDQGKIFEGAGPSLFVEDNMYYYILAIMISKIGKYTIGYLNPTLNTNIGDVNNIPVIVDDAKKEKVDNIVKENIELSKADWDSFEQSWDFKRHPLV